MTHEVPLLEREEALAHIDQRIAAWGTRQVLCIGAAGGIGKTRLLQEVCRRYSSTPASAEQVIITDIIDFDDHALHVRQNVGGKIAQMLGQDIFEPYHRAIQDLRTMEVSGISSDQLAQQWLAVEHTLVACFNSISEQRRVLLCLDTIEELEAQDVWEHLTRMLFQLDNMVLLVAGRNAHRVAEQWQADTSINQAAAIAALPLAPLSVAGSTTYLQHRQTILQTRLEPALTEKLVLLAAGNPLLLNTATEWHARGASFTWLNQQDLEPLKALPAPALQQQQQEFVRQLATHITETGQAMDWLIMVMACVYPLDVEAIIKFLGVDEEEAHSLFEEASSYVFVKRFADGRISLHDEMRRMVNDYVWAEIDPDGNPRRRESRITAEYLEREVQVILRRIEQLQAEEQRATAQAEEHATLQLFTARESLEQELWSIKGQLLDHVLFVDVDTGVETFSEMFDEATRAYRFHFRGILLSHMQNYADQLSPEQRYELRSRQVKYFLDEGEYQLTENLVTEILEREDITPEQHITMLIQRANAAIRLGNVDKGIEDFGEAVRISESNNLTMLIIKSKNALGWAHRLVGELDMAIARYREARALCLQAGTLDDDYGWILNNLTFVLSYRNHRSAIGFGQSAIEYWQSIGNNIGLGAAHLVLGMVYYHSGFYERALASLQKALDIFEPLELQSWIGQILLWRGAVFQDMGDLNQALNNLQDALDIGSRNIEAMTLGRLGALHIALQHWDLAERYLVQSYDLAQTIPDMVSWITALAHLIAIAAEQQQGGRLEEWTRKVQDFLGRIKTPDENALSMAYMGLARLALQQQDTTAATEFLSKGISLGAVQASYIRTNILTHMAQVEHEFVHIAPEAVRQIGQTLKELFVAREAEDIAYGVVTPVMYRWATFAPEPPAATRERDGILL